MLVCFQFYEHCFWESFLLFTSQSSDLLLFDFGSFRLGLYRKALNGFRYWCC